MICHELMEQRATKETCMCSPLEKRFIIVSKCIFMFLRENTEIDFQVSCFEN